VAETIVSPVFDEGMGGAPEGEEEVSPEAAWQAACSAALVASLEASGYEEDVRAIATDAGVCAAAAGVRGVLVGLTFLLPDVDYDAPG
jgi:hypothetical protein